MIINGAMSRVTSAQRMLPSLRILVKAGLLQDVKLFELNYTCKDIAGLYNLGRYHILLRESAFNELSYESITLSVLVCFDVLFLIFVQIEVSPLRTSSSLRMR